MGERVAVVEDEQDVRETVLELLLEAGFEAVGYSDGEQALGGIRTSPPDVVLLDVKMPGMDGLEVCRRLRRDLRTASLPIVMLTALSGEEDVVLGFDVGADDYVTKPLMPRALVSHVRAVLKRARPRATDAPITHGPLSLSPALQRVTLDGKPLGLTPSEFQIVYLLASSHDRAVTRAEILERLGAPNDPHARKVDIHVAAIRAKLGRHAGLIATVRGIGYRIG